MPAGAKPGERRGGRQKGTPNKVKSAEVTNFAEAMKIAVLAAGPELIDSLTPAQLLRHFSREATKAGFVQAGLAWAKDCAVYFDRRMDGEDESAAITINVTGGLPDDPNKKSK
jgi:hypothetical protein